MIRLVICLFLLAASLSGEAQQTTDKKTLKLISKADELLADRSFSKARDVLIDAIERDPKFEKAYQKLFITLRVLAQDEDLISWQQRYIEDVPLEFLDSRIWQNLASYHHSKGEYSKALELISNVDKPDSVLLHSINFSIETLANPDEIVVSELPSELNPLQFQYLPVLTLDGQTLIFTGIKSDGQDEDIYQTTFDGTKWQTAESISAQINTPYNEGACTISADGRTLIFTACEGRRTFGSCDLFIAKKEGDEWVEIRNMGKNVNSRFWDSQPTLSADGRTLYFVSNRPGGVGGKDIWKSKLEGDSWSHPENLGSPVNTKRDESTPFIFADDRTLFFSSNGHIGLGGFDLYCVESLQSEDRSIKNLGSPVNTHNDEVSLFVSSDGQKGYFAKEIIENGRVVSSRLQSYELDSKPIIQGVHYLTGIVSDLKTKEVLSADIELVNLKSREVEYKTSSDPKSGRYFLVLPPGQDYGIFVERSGYLLEELSFITGTKTITDTVDFQLKPIEVGANMVLQNIYFDFDSDQIKPESLEELERVLRLLRNHPNLQVQISGHTDNVGEEGYNQDLSERRAIAVVNYLIGNGIKESRLTTKGFGSSAPRTTNNSESERQKNRRIEFEIIESR